MDSTIKCSDRSSLRLRKPVISKQDAGDIRIIETGSIRVCMSKLAILVDMEIQGFGAAAVELDVTGRSSDSSV